MNTLSNMMLSIMDLILEWILNIQKNVCRKMLCTAKALQQQHTSWRACFFCGYAKGEWDSREARFAKTTWRLTWRVRASPKIKLKNWREPRWPPFPPTTTKQTQGYAPGFRDPADPKDPALEESRPCFLLEKFFFTRPPALPYLCLERGQKRG